MVKYSRRNVISDAPRMTPQTELFNDLLKLAVDSWAVTIVLSVAFLRMKV